MAGIEIPDLYQKCRLLIDYRVAAGWDELAKTFGVSPATVKWWGQGSAVRARGILPAIHLDVFVKLVANALPPNTSPESIEGFVFGTAPAFEEALRRRDPALLDHLLATEGNRSSIRLILKPDQTGLVETEDEDRPDADAAIPLGAYFRIECASPQPVRHAVAIQNAQKIWGGVTAAIAPAGRQILVPGYGKDGAPAFMRERKLGGLNRFIVFQTADPAPRAIDERMRMGIALDYPALTTLIDFYRAQPEATRRLYLLEVQIGEDS